MTAAIVASALAASTLAIAAAPDFGAIDAYVEAQRGAQHIPGLALGIAGGDGTIHVAGFGRADESGRAVTGDTPFILGSTSKSFTALAVMQLVEAGTVELDAPVQRYLPWFRVADEKASSGITVRHLLNQTSGLSTASGRRTLTDFSSGDDALENRVRALHDVAPTTPVGTTFQYSNCNYQVLGLIVQQVSGERFEAYLKNHIFVPLAMHNTFTSKEQAAQFGLAQGHRDWFGHPLAFDEPYPRAGIPQGFIISTARDMSHYLSAHLNGGRFGDASVLSPAGIAELHRGAARIGDSDEYYAMGWNAGTVGGQSGLWHGGDTFSFQSFMLLLTDARWGIVIMKDVANIPASRSFEDIAYGVVDLLVGRPAAAAHADDSAWVHAIVLGIVALQVIGMTRTVILWRRWQREPAKRPVGRLATALRLALPSAVNLFWALTIFVGLPLVFGPVSLLTWGMPDLGYPLLASAAVALLWSALRTRLMYRIARA